MIMCRKTELDVRQWNDFYSVELFSDRARRLRLYPIALIVFPAYLEKSGGCAAPFLSYPKDPMDQPINLATSLTMYSGSFTSGVVSGGVNAAFHGGDVWTGMWTGGANALAGEMGRDVGTAAGTAARPYVQAGIDWTVDVVKAAAMEVGSWFDGDGNLTGAGNNVAPDGKSGNTGWAVSKIDWSKAPKEYDTIEKALVAASMYARQLTGSAAGNEYSGVVYLDPETGMYSFTTPVEGGKSGSQPANSLTSVPEGCYPVAYYHSHPTSNFLSPYGPDEKSGDLTYARDNGGLPIAVGTPNGSVIVGLPTKDFYAGWTAPSGGTVIYQNGAFTSSAYNPNLYLMPWDQGYDYTYFNNRMNGYYGSGRDTEGTPISSIPEEERGIFVGGERFNK